MVVQDLTSLLDKQDTTAFDADSQLFGNFDEGGVFHVDQAKIRDLDKMLDRYGKAKTLEQALSLPLRAAAWSIQRDESEAEVYEFINDLFTRPANNGGMTTPMSLVIAQMTGAIVYKKAFFEKVFTVRDKRVVYDKLAWCPASTCAVKRDPRSGTFQGFRQDLVTGTDGVKQSDIDKGYVEISPERSFVYIHGQHRSPLDGVSDFEIVHWCYLTSQKIRFLWYSFLEGQALPKTIVRGRTQTEANKVANKMRGLRNGGIAAFDENMAKIDPYESSGQGADQFKEALRWLDSEASGSVLASFTDLGATAAGGTGSFALSKDQTDFFLMSRQAVAREMQDSVNQYTIADLVRHNFGPDAKSPRFEFGPIAEDDAQTSVSLLQSIANNPSDKIPAEFMDELVERVAGFLDLSTQRVRDGLEKAREAREAAAAAAGASPQAQQVAGVAGAVDSATNAVVRATAATPEEPPA